MSKHILKRIAFLMIFVFLFAFYSPQYIYANQAQYERYGSVIELKTGINDNGLESCYMEKQYIKDDEKLQMRIVMM